MSINRSEKLFDYLDSLGYDRKYIQTVVLPDWFCSQYFEECPDDSLTYLSWELSKLYTQNKLNACFF